MGDYFQPLRRKIGVMALVFMGGWVRSLIVFDAVRFNIGNHTGAGFMSMNQSIVLASANLETWEPPEWQTGSSSSADSVLDGGRITWRFRWYGFGVGTLAQGDMGMMISTIPYWSIVIPLTLLSAYLLLSKPRPAKTPTDAG